MTETENRRSGLELRAHRRQRMRDEVRAAALKLFATRGFDEVTVEEIAAQTHISQRTFFRYFATKEDLVFDREPYFALLGEILREIPPEEPPAEALQHAFVGAFKAFESDRRSLAALRRVLLKNPSLISRATGPLLTGMDPIVEILAKRMECDPDTDMRPMVLVATALVTAMTVIRMWSLDGSESLSSLQSRISSPANLLDVLATPSQKASA